MFFLNGVILGTIPAACIFMDVKKNKNRTPIRHLKLGGLLACLLLISACGTWGRTDLVGPSPERALGRTTDAYEKRIEKQLRAEYKRWKGAKHAMGGTSRAGVDCSGFVKTVYKNLFNITLPRTTKDQVREGIPVPRHALQPGDLVFFRPPSYPRHVGIYLNSNTFLHASKTNGVTVSVIDGHYWGQYYWTARRLPISTTATHEGPL